MSADERPPAPEGWVWATFVGGTKDGAVELVHGEAGTYEKIVTGEVWRAEGAVFSLVWDGEE